MEPKNNQEWTAHIKDLKNEYPLKYDHSQLSCPYVIEQIDEITKGDAIITTDVGQHHARFLRVFRFPGCEHSIIIIQNQEHF